MAKFVDGIPVPDQTVSSTNAAQDYNLIKYQNKHNNMGETYDVVRSVVTKKDGFDVITIKDYKDFFGDREGIKLSELITLLWANGYNYEMFLCSFCRGGAHFDVKAFFTGENTSHEPVLFEHRNIGSI